MEGLDIGGKVAMTTPQTVAIPKLNLDSQKSTDKKDRRHSRHDSNSSRGSIGRKERLRNALTGRSENSDAGGDQPKELPDEEMCDFMSLYDDSDFYSRKLVITNMREDSMGSIGSDSDELKETLEEEKQSEDKSNGQSGFEGG